MVKVKSYPGVDYITAGEKHTRVFDNRRVDVLMCEQGVLYWMEVIAEGETERHIEFENFADVPSPYTIPGTT